MFSVVGTQIYLLNIHVLRDCCQSIRGVHGNGISPVTAGSHYHGSPVESRGKISREWEWEGTRSNGNGKDGNELSWEWVGLNKGHGNGTGMDGKGTGMDGTKPRIMEMIWNLANFQDNF